MPIYEFACPKCEHHFEKIISVAEYMRTEDHTPCPECFHLPAKRVWNPCALRTATRWASREGTLLDQFGDTPEGRKQLGIRVRQAKRKGYTPNMHDVYDPTVAQSVGDPGGFIPQDDPQGHMKRKMAEVGVGCEEPLFRAPASPSDPGPSKPLADDIATGLVKREIKKNPDLAQRDRAELREQIVKKHSYQKE